MNKSHSRNDNGNINQWQMNRRKFLKGLIAAGIISQAPWITSCSTEDNSKKKNQFSTIETVQNHLWPADGNGPSAQEIHALEYLKWVLQDDQLPEVDKNFILNGSEWLNQWSDEKYQKSFNSLETALQKEILDQILNEEWGDQWVSMLINFILEALLADPIYGGNTNKAGWTWLDHFAGNPRPTKELLYPNIFTTLNMDYA